MRRAAHDVVSGVLARRRAKITQLVGGCRARVTDTLVLTVDVHAAASRENNMRVGFTMPLRPSCGLRGMASPSALDSRDAVRTLLKNGMPHFENSGATRGVPIFRSAAVREFGLARQARHGPMSI